MADADVKPVVAEGEEEVKKEIQEGEVTAEGEAPKTEGEETAEEKTGDDVKEDATDGEEQATDGAGEGGEGGEEKQEEEVKTEEAPEEQEAKVEAEEETEQAAPEGDAPAEAEEAENKEEEATESAAKDDTPEEEEKEEAGGEEKEEKEGDDNQAEEPQEEEGEAGEEEETTVDGEQVEPEEAEGEEKSAVELSDEEREKYRQIFERKAVNDRLDLKGFKILFRLMGEVSSSEEAEQMFEDGDKDDSNTIDFDEFCRLYSKFSQAEQARKESMLQSIDKLFPSNDGEPVELRKVERLLLKLQQPDLDMRLVREKSDLGENDIKSLVKAMDKDGNGKISKQEFVDTLCQHLEV